MSQDSRGFFAAVVGDGRPLITFTGICLALSGAFALFQSATGHFLPHDTEFLRMTADDLCSINECRVVHFMVHDRVSFGGSLIAIAVMYVWLAEFPLKSREAWAWWLLLLSGIVGFGSFLTYLGYGYLDSWHGAATLALLPCFVSGLWLSRPRVDPEIHMVAADISWRSVLWPGCRANWRSTDGLGRGCPDRDRGTGMLRGWNDDSTDRHVSSVRVDRSGVYWVVARATRRDQSAANSAHRP